MPPRRHRRLLDRITTDEGDRAGSWVHEWSAEAGRLAAGGHLLTACRHYNMARFPYVDGPARQRALEECVGAFDAWRADGTGIEPVTADLPGGPVPCWSIDLSARDRRPLLLVMGGIVSVKEQWAPVLVQARRLGMAGLVAEMPGVGQNPLRYGPESMSLVSELLDAVADRADVDRTYAVALSFSGHLALRAAVDDSRIRGIITAGAPVRRFFTDTVWQAGLPRVTVDTLTHISGNGLAGLRSMALEEKDLKALTVPVYCLVSRRDEIIPGEDPAFIRRHVRDTRVVENDDVHGSPRTFLDSRLWIMRSILELTGGRAPQRAALTTLLGARRAFRAARPRRI